MRSRVFNLLAYLRNLGHGLRCYRAGEGSLHDLWRFARGYEYD